MPTQVLLSCDVRVLDPKGTRASAVALRDGRILAVGGEKDVLHAAGADAACLDLRGATVLPGFIDAHQHPSIASLYGGGVRLAPPSVSSIADVQRTLADAARSLPPGEWLVATQWDEGLLAERRAPTRQELDDAVPDRPLFALHYSCHRAVANSRALELAGIGRHTPDPPGGVVSRGKDGLPDGLLIERGMSAPETLARSSLRARDAEGFLSRLHTHLRALAAAGITRVVDAAVPLDLVPLYREAEARGLLTIPTVMMPVASNGYFEAPWEVLESPATGARHGSLSVGPIKLIMDGAPTCAMCLSWRQVLGTALRTWGLSMRARSLDPIRTSLSTSPRMGWKVETGIRMYDVEGAVEIVRRAAEAGFAVASHAEGNAAIDTALAAYEGAGSALHGAGVPRIEHFIFAGPDHVKRIAAVGAAVVAQPHFLSLPAFRNAPTIPGLRTKPLRWLLDAGVTVAGSSDYPVTGFDPLDGIRSAVTRNGPGLGAREPDQRIDLDEALVLYTRSAARVSGCDAECGTLEVGKRADVVVLSGALRSPADLEDARVAATIVGGKVAFGKLSSAAS